MHTYFDTRLAQCHPKLSQGSNKKIHVVSGKASFDGSGEALGRLWLRHSNEKLVLHVCRTLLRFEVKKAYPLLPQTWRNQSQFTQRNMIKINSKLSALELKDPDVKTYL